MKIRVSTAARKAIPLASLAVALISFAAPAHAQYMVIDGVSASAATEEQIICQSMYVQDYSSFQGVSNEASEINQGTSSLQILNGLFDGYIGVFGTVIAIPAIIIAVLRLFVHGQIDRKPKKRIFALPAAPAPTRLYRPSPAANH